MRFFFAAKSLMSKDKCDETYKIDLKHQFINPLSGVVLFKSSLFTI